MVDTSAHRSDTDFNQPLPCKVVKPLLLQPSTTPDLLSQPLPPLSGPWCPALQCSLPISSTRPSTKEVNACVEMANRCMSAGESPVREAGCVAISQFLEFLQPEILDKVGVRVVASQRDLRCQPISVQPDSNMSGGVNLCTLSCLLLPNIMVSKIGMQGQNLIMPLVYRSNFLFDNAAGVSVGSSSIIPSSGVQRCPCRSISGAIPYR